MRKARINGTYDLTSRQAWRRIHFERVERGRLGRRSMSGNCLHGVTSIPRRRAASKGVVANDPNVLIFYDDPHIEKRMKQRKVSKLDVKSILTSCAVINVELDVFEERWTAEGRDQDGRLLRIVVVTNEVEREIDVVTVMDLGKGEVT